MTQQDHSDRRPRSWRFVIGGAIIVAVIGYLIVSSAQDVAVYALTISELQAHEPSIYGQGVRVGGTIDGESIIQDAHNLVLSFNLVDGEQVLHVVYKGVAPDAFRDGAPALVEGKYNRDGVFEAAKLLLKCPSKYEAALQPGD